VQNAGASPPANALQRLRQPLFKGALALHLGRLPLLNVNDVVAADGVLLVVSKNALEHVLCNSLALLTHSLLHSPHVMGQQIASV
jgi:hypothetical protein